MASESPPTTASENRAAQSTNSCLDLCFCLGEENDDLGERKENESLEERDAKDSLGETGEYNGLGDRAPLLTLRRDVDRYIIQSCYQDRLRSPVVSVYLCIFLFAIEIKTKNKITKSGQLSFLPYIIPTLYEYSCFSSLV